ncbi:MAG TPA: alpha/beta hydrolase [Thauera aminoaromatica]|jgi:hypothetical protein|nr:alpha/beta hydrolase [Burkholderiaceae bacterium]HNC68288.1 alpha/beta hydrolase [Thauera aminoaromatica]HNF77824.1 alpha/beta hydrolase [Thauera aminoaromatica]HNH71846.1 alpha/beta hydrolase [Pseudomonadales bacterium]
MDNSHFIHSRGGRIGGRADTKATDVDAIVAALCADPRRHLVIHFHGGLVSKASGLDIAGRLFDDYSPSATAGAYPVFYVWESGAWETIRNNFTELADEPVFKQLLRKALQYALEKLGGSAAAGVGRSIAPGSTGSRESEVRQELEAFWAAPGKENIPFRDLEPRATPAQARTVEAALEENEIIADLERDGEFQRALATLPDLPRSARSAFGSADASEHRSAFAEMAAAEFSKTSRTRGLVELIQVARFLIRVTRAVLGRRAAGRDHGLYATCVEEIVRAFKVGGSGVHEWAQALEWNRMKQDVADAFGPDPNRHAGTALLARLGRALKDGLALDRITLVGHSTGAIYIAQWLAHARDHLPADFKQDVVFLAPAITYELFADTLAKHADRIGQFRMFAMHDALERDDQVWGGDEELGDSQDWRRFVYPASLLYLVSGILERTADEPLLGMERFFTDAQTYGAAADPALASIDAVRTWLTGKPNALVWSIANNAGPGLRSTSIDHGAFDNDAVTRESLRHIVGSGF